MSLTEILLPIEHRGLPLTIAADRGASLAQRTAAIEGAAITAAQALQPDINSVDVSKLVVAWMRAVESSRPPQRLGRDWPEYLTRLRHTNTVAESTVTAVLRVLVDEGSRDLCDPDRAWLVTHYVTSVKFIHAARQRAQIYSYATQISATVGERMARTASGLDMEDAPKAFEVAAAVERALTSWANAGRIVCHAGSDWLALNAFITEVVQVLDDPPEMWWHFLWANLDRELTERAGSTPHPLSRVLDRLAMGVPVYAALRAWPLVAMAEGTPDALRDLAQALTLMSDGTVDQLDLALAIGEEPLSRVASDYDLTRLAFQTRESMRRTLERHQIDPLIRAIDQITAMTKSHEHSEALTRQLADGVRALALVLAEGLKGSTAADRMEQLLRGTLGAAIRAACNSDAPRTQQALFRQLVSNELGAGNRPEWRRYREVLPGLRRLLADAAHPLAGRASELIGQLDPLLAFSRACPVDWADDACERHGGSQPGATPQRLGDLFRWLNVNHRVHNAYDAAHAAWMGWSLTVPDPSQIDADAVHAALAKIAADLAEHSASNDLVQALQQQAAAALAGVQLPALSWRLATFTADQVFDALPEYADRVSATGHASCIRDNAMTLNALGRILYYRRPDPSEALWGWWSVSVEPYLANRPAGMFPQNLAGLANAIHTLMSAKEGTLVTKVLRDVYQSYLNVDLEIAREQGRPTKPRPYPTLGPHGQAIFGRAPNPMLARRLSWVADEGSLSAVDVPKCVSTAVRAYASALMNAAVPEVALQRAARPILDAVLEIGSAQLDLALCRVGDASPAGAAPLDGVYWRAVLTPLRQGAADIAVGYAMLTHAPTVARIVASALAHRDLPTAENFVSRCARDQSLFLAFVGRQLSSGQSVTGALEASRFLVMAVAPFVSYDASTWRLVFTATERALWPYLDLVGRAALVRFMRQLSALAEMLPALHAIGESALHAPEVIFSESPDEDQRWRELVASLLAVIATGPGAYYAPSVLVQRLVLLDPVLGGETSASWPERGAALAAFLCQKLPDAAGPRIRAVIDEILVQLMNVERGNAVASRGLATWSALESGHPFARPMWQADLLIRAQSSSGLRTPEDLFVTQATGWALPEPRVIEATGQALVEVLSFDRDIELRAAKRGGILGWFDKAPPALSSDVQAAIRLWMRSSTVATTLGFTSATETLQDLVPLVPEAIGPLALLGGIADHGPGAARTLAADAINAATDAWLAQRLLSEPEVIAEGWVNGASPQWVSDHERCVRDLTFLVLKIGAHRAGWTPQTPEAFYQEQVWPFLVDETPTTAARLIGAAPKALASTLGETYAIAIGHAVDPVTKLLQTPRGQA